MILIVVVMMNLWPHEYLNRKFGEESVVGTVVLRYMPSLRETIEEAALPLPDAEDSGRRR